MLPSDRLFEPGIGATIRTDDFEVLEQYAPGWSQEFEQVGHGRFHGSLDFAQSARMQFGLAHWSPGVAIRGAVPPKTVVVAIPLRAVGTGMERGEVMHEGEAAVIPGDAPLDFRATGSFRLFVTSVSPAQLEEHTQRVLGCSFGALARGGRIVTAAGRGSMQAAVERFGMSALFEDPVALCDPVVARWAEHRVLDVILHGAAAPSMRGAVPGSVRIARLAEEFLRAHLTDPVTIRELCAAVGVPERTLHLAFERHIGVSPKAYLKSARLHAVRHDLRRAPAHLSVTRIAMQWGFFHPGWFSHDYHRMFGCTPSETRRHAVERLAVTG